MTSTKPESSCWTNGKTGPRYGDRSYTAAYELGLITLVGVFVARLKTWTLQQHFNYIIFV